MTQVNFYSKEQTDALLEDIASDISTNAGNISTNASDIAALETAVGTSSDAESSSGTLWARIKYGLSQITSLWTADAQNVKLTGSQTVTGTKSMSSTSNDLRVLTTPAATTAAVNQAYVESTVSGVNNIVHKSANETITGIKTFTGRLNGGGFGVWQDDVTSSYTATSNKWRYPANLSISVANAYIINVSVGLNNTAFGIGKFYVFRDSSDNIYCKKIYSYGSTSGSIPDIAVSYDTDPSKLKIWVKKAAYNNCYFYIENRLSYGNITNNDIKMTASDDSNDYDSPTDTNVIMSTAMVVQ